MAVIIPVNDIRKYFLEHQEMLKDKYVLVAENTEEDGVEIYLTSENGLPTFEVDSYYGNIKDVETANSLDEIERLYEEFICLYVGVEYPITMDDDDMDRAEEISQYTIDYLAAMMECDPADYFDNMDVTVEDIALAFENFLYNEYGFSVRHPYDTGNGIVEYPCEEGIEY